MKNVIFLLLIMSFQSSLAEKLIFTNNNEQVDIEGEAQIDFETGDISVTTVGEHLIVDSNENTPVILGFYPSDYDIATGSSITVYWTVAFAESCVASTTSGTSTWSGTKTAANGSYGQGGISVNVLPANLELECQNSSSGTTTKSFLITEQTGGGGGSNPAINNFRVNSQSPTAVVGPSTSATVTWSTTDVNNCSASANPAVPGWSGSVATQGGAGTAVTIDQDTVLTLTCDSLQRTVSVTYTQNSSCTTSIYPAGLSIVQATYASRNDDQPFGVSTNTSFELDMQNTTFHSLSGFSFPQADSRRRINLVDAPTQRQIDQSTMSISECPGDFSPTAACVIPISTSLPNSVVLFSTKPADNPDFFCILDPTKTYYANFVNSPDPYNVTPSCAIGSNIACTVFYSENLQN